MASSKLSAPAALALVSNGDSKATSVNSVSVTNGYRFIAFTTGRVIVWLRRRGSKARNADRRQREHRVQGGLIFIGSVPLFLELSVNIRTLHLMRPGEILGGTRSQGVGLLHYEAKQRWRKLLIYARIIAKCAQSIANEQSCWR